MLDWQVLSKWHKNHHTLCGIDLQNSNSTIAKVLQDDGTSLVESSEDIEVFREHTNSAGEQVSTAASLNVSAAPS